MPPPDPDTPTPPPQRASPSLGDTGQRGEHLPGDPRMTYLGASVLPTLPALSDPGDTGIDRQGCPPVSSRPKGLWVSNSPARQPWSLRPGEGQKLPGLSPQGPQHGKGMAGEGRWHSASPYTPTPRHSAGLPVASVREWEPNTPAFQELPNQASNWSAGLLAWLGIPNILQEDVPGVPPEYYSCQFKLSKLSR